MKTRLVNIAPYESQGWFLTQDTTTRFGKRSIVSKPLSALPTETAVAETAEPKAFEFMPTFREQDENGKFFCRKCGHKLTAVKSPFCPWCGGKFIEEDTAHE